MFIGIGSSPCMTALYPLAAAFSPLDLTNLELWLDASDLSTITHVLGAVSQWDDKSGNGNHAVQGTASAQPTTGIDSVNSLNAVLFDGSGERMPLPAALNTLPNGENCLFVVHKSISGGTDRRRVLRDPLWGIDRLDFASGTRLAHSGGNHLFYTGTGSNTSTIVETINANATVSAYLDGVFKASTTRTFATASDIVLGGHSTANSAESYRGDMCEVIAYSDARTTTEMNQIGDYLTRWGTIWTDI